MELIKSWQLHQNPTTLDFYIVYSLGRTDAETWLSVVDKCTPNCAREGALDVSAFATITANSTHWFACFKQVMSEGQVIQNGFYMCSTSSDLLGPIAVYPIDTDYPIKDTTGEDRMYSCMMDETTMILAVSSSDTQKYSLYSLDTSNIFNITGKTPTDGNGYIMSMSCRDQVILVATLNKIDYWVWDDGTGFVFPPISGPSALTPPVEPVAEPVADAPTSTPTVSTPDSVPVDTPIVGNPVGAPGATLNTTADELQERDKTLIGVLIGVGVPVLAGAITLIILRKKLKKKRSDDGDSVYTAIDLLNKDDPLFEKKMLIPFKQLNFTKEIGSGSFGKVYLGKWRGATVAIKMNNQIADTAGFLAEARLTL
jgi:hypothetical protein